MGRVKFIKPAIQDQPATFSSIVSKGSLTVNGAVTISGSLFLSGSEDLVVTDITASGNISGSGTGSFAHIQLPGEGTIQFDNTPGSNDQYIQGYDNNINIYADTQLFLNAERFTFAGGPITASSNISASGEINTNGLTNVGSTSTTLSSSFTTTLNFSTNRIMSVTTASALSMSIDTGNSIIGNVIMTDISSSVGLYLTGSEFKVLNGTFDTTKRNYVYYHYIGNDTALVTINQES